MQRYDITSDILVKTCRLHIANPNSVRRVIYAFAMNKNEYAFICNVAANLAVKINNFSLFGFKGTRVTLPCKNYATLRHNI